MNKEGDSEMDLNKENSLQLLCTESNIVRELYYGTTYRASFAIGEENGTWDILHIAIPFSPIKESAFMRRFHVNRERMDDYYKEFSRAVHNHVLLSKALTEEQGIDSLKRSIVAYKTVQTFTRSDMQGNTIGTDIYLISEPMETFVDSESFQSTGAFLLTINNLGIRLLQTAKSMNEQGVTMGAVDLESYYLVNDPTGKKLLKNGYLFYGSSERLKSRVYTPDVAPFIIPELSVGACMQSMDTDVYMICKMLWNLYDGQHYSVPADLRYEPRYASREIIEALKEGMENGAASYKRLNLALRALNKQIESGEEPNSFIPFSPPSYENVELPELRQDTTVQTKDTPEENDREKKHKKRPRKGGLIFIPVIVAFLVIGLYGPLRGIFENSGITVTPEVTNSAMSGEEGLFILNEKVVNADGTENAEYFLDENKNIVIRNRETKEINVVYDPAHCSTYIPVEAYTVKLVSKDFQIDDPEHCLVFKDNVVNLRKTEVMIRSDSTENEIDKDIIEQYGIDEDSVLLVNSIDYLGEKRKCIATVYRQDGESGTDRYFMHLDNALSDRDIQEVHGLWTYVFQIKATPENTTCKSLRAEVDEPDCTCFSVERDGKKIEAQSIRGQVDERGNIEVTVICKTEGNHTFRIESGDKMTEKRFSMTFNPEENVLPIPTPTPEPTPTITPAPTPEPTPAATPTPIPTQNPWAVSYPEAYYPSQPTYWENPPVTQAPVPSYEPASAPDYVPSFTCDVSSLNMRVGESTTLYPSESCSISAYPAGIVRISGNLITAIGVGSCTITLTCTLAELRGQQLTVTVLVE